MHGSNELVSLMHFKNNLKRKKPNKIWLDQGGEFYNKVFQSFLKINNIEMYSTYNKKNLFLLKDLLRR